MRLTPSQAVELLGPCTQNLADCEIVRAAIVLNQGNCDNQPVQALRSELAKLACADCVKCYLMDV